MLKQFGKTGQLVSVLLMSMTEPWNGETYISEKGTLFQNLKNQKEHRINQSTNDPCLIWPRACKLTARSLIPNPITEPEQQAANISLSCTQGAANGPYPESHEFSLYHKTLLFKIYFNISLLNKLSINKLLGITSDIKIIRSSKGWLGNLLERDHS